MFATVSLLVQQMEMREHARRLLDSCDYSAREAEFLNLIRCRIEVNFTFNHANLRKLCICGYLLDTHQSSFTYIFCAQAGQRRLFFNSRLHCRIRIRIYCKLYADGGIAGRRSLL